jgi:hypothetical protein
MCPNCALGQMARSSSSLSVLRTILERRGLPRETSRRAGKRLSGSRILRFGAPSGGLTPKGLSKLSKSSRSQIDRAGETDCRNKAGNSPIPTGQDLVSKTVSGHFGPTRVRIPPPPLSTGIPCKAGLVDSRCVRRVEALAPHAGSEIVAGSPLSPTGAIARRSHDPPQAGPGAPRTLGSKLRQRSGNDLHPPTRLPPRKSGGTCCTLRWSGPDAHGGEFDRRGAGRQPVVGRV